MKKIIPFNLLLTFLTDLSFQIIVGQYSGFSDQALTKIRGNQFSMVKPTEQGCWNQKGYTGIVKTSDTIY